MKHSLAAVILLTGLVPSGCFAPAMLRPPDPLPETGFSFYSGADDNAGDYYLAVVEMKHREKDQTVVLVSMLHGANRSFYRQVQEEIDRADRVLTEGVWGAPSLGPTLFTLPYFVGLYHRDISYSGLMRQDEGLDYGANYRNADLSYGAFQNQMPWWAPFLQTLVVPPMLVFLETRHLFWLTDRISTGLGMGDGFDAARRHAIAQSIEDDDDQSDRDSILFPGIIDARNRQLLKVFDLVMRDPEVKRVAIPWGADHMHGLFESLTARGYVETEHRWLRTLSIRTLLEEGARSEDRPFDLQVPYLVRWRAAEGAWSLSLLCRSLFMGFDETGYNMKFLWELLLSCRGNSQEQTLQVLPALCGRPLFFEWARRGERARLRFLWFFEIGSLSGAE